VDGGASSSCDGPSSSRSSPYASSSSSSSLSLNVGVRDEDLVAGARCDDDDFVACDVSGTETSA
jgi:hypothetical protein